MLRHYDVLSVRDQARHSSILMTDIYTPHDIQEANDLIKIIKEILVSRYQAVTRRWAAWYSKKVKYEILFIILNLRFDLLK